MPLTCNIDAKGKRARLIFGLVLVVLGVALLCAWALPVGSVAAWLLTGSCLGIGSFAVFEARAGWCAVRAMGFRTPV